MIKISKDKQRKVYQVFFNGDNFFEILQTLKISNLNFNKDNKAWEGDVNSLDSVLGALFDIEPIEFDYGLEEEIEKDISDSFETEYFDDADSLQESDLLLPPLKDFQFEDIRKGVSQSRLALFHDMGMGKAYISANIVDQHIRKGRIDKVLIVCPTEGLYNYRRELIRFSNEFTYDNVSIANRYNRKPFTDNAKAVIMTYRTFLLISDDYYKEKNNGKVVKNYRKPTIPFDTWGTTRAIVTDESHNFANSTARQTKALHLHKDYFEFRYILTGTPTPNTFTQIYSQLKFIEPTLFSESYQQWIQRIANVGNRYSKWAVNYVYEDKMQEEEERFSPWVIRRRFHDYLDVPEAFIDKIYMELPELQSTIYKKLVEQELNVVKEENGFLHPKKVIAKFPYISQALDDPILLKGKIDKMLSPELYNLVENKWKFTDSMKYEMLESLLDKYIKQQSEKVVVFDFHPKILDALAENLDKYNPLVIHGQNTPKGQEQNEFRDGLIEDFRNNPDRKLLIASSEVLKTAVNLQFCSKVIYYSRNYSYLTWSQTKGRFVRPGQDKVAVMHPFIYENSLDELLDKALEKKHSLNEGLFTQGREVKESYSQQEWKDIFTGKGEV